MSQSPFASLGLAATSRAWGVFSINQFIDKPKDFPLAVYEFDLRLRDGSAVRNTYCSFRGPEFGSPGPTAGGSQPPVTLALRFQHLWPPQAPSRMTQTFRHTYIKNKP